MNKKKVFLFALAVLPIMYIIVNYTFFVHIGNEKYSIFSKDILIYHDVNTYFDEVKTPVELSPLKRCKRLRSLYISRPCDLGVLKELEGIENFSVRLPAVISDYSPISSLENLKYCYIDDDGFKDIEPLQDIRSLETVIISHTSVSDISALNKLNGLRKLDISDTNVSDISVIGNMPELCDIWLNGCPISDYSVLTECENLKVLCASRDQLPDDIKEKLEKKGVSIAEE